MGEPDDAVACPSVLVIERFACGVRVSVSVAALLAGLGSVTPPGAVTVAVLLSLPVADALIVPVRVWVTVAPPGRLTVSLMLPDPLGPHVPPPAPRQVQVTPVIAAGTESATVAPVTEVGPALDATIV